MTTQEFIFNAPLYQKVKGAEADSIVSELQRDGNFAFDRIQFDGYNSVHRVDSTYYVSRPLNTRNNITSSFHTTKPFDDNEVWFVTLICGKYQDTIDIVLFITKEKTIMKIGQYPSIADIHIGQVKQYNKILSKEHEKEFTRAIGLAANGVGIGSFVYLRRIFERLIFTSAEKAIAKGVITREDFQPLRINEKIKILKDYLPETLVELQQVYGILSKGLHELSEDECLLYFDVIRQGIEMMLDDMLTQRQKEERKKKTLDAVSKISSELSSK